MEYVRLGRTGMKVSRICLGMMSFGTPGQGTFPWTLSLDDARPFVRRAAEGGINFFDTADVYSKGVSEEITGKLVKEFMPRDQAVIATKVINPMGPGPNDSGLSRKHIMDAIDGSLRRLGTDYVDLWQIHRFDRHTPIEETMEALHDVVKAGKARYIGASSMFAWQFAKMLHTSELNGWTKFVSMQPQYSLIFREDEREMLPLCLDAGVGVIPWSPLGRGTLSRPPNVGGTLRAEKDTTAAQYPPRPADLEVAQAVTDVAKARGVTNTQIALAWTLRNPAITAPIIGATKLSHIDDAVAALSIKLTDDEAALLEARYQYQDAWDRN